MITPWRYSYIPGSIPFDLAHGIGDTVTFELPRNLPTGDSFQQYARAAGVCQQSHVVVYDRDYKNEWAARAWCMFKVMNINNITPLSNPELSLL